MLPKVEVEARSIQRYRDLIGDDRIRELEGYAEALRGKRVLHLNATAYGGGVAEILITLVPLMRDLGLDAEWRVIQGHDAFFGVTKCFHNALQGQVMTLTDEMRQVYLDTCRANAEAFSGNYDFVVAHDPQTAAIKHFMKAPPGQWIWRCHIDLTAAERQVWDFLRPYVQEHEAAIFTLEQYVKDDLRVPVVAIIPPAIDPLSPKNAPLSSAESRAVLARFGVDPDRPILLQVSRFDPWKDPLGVIDAYRLVKREIPEVQLVLAGSMASDDPEGWLFYDRTLRHAGEDFDIHVLSNFNGVGNLEINALQRESDVVVQKSTREGFGLVVAEGLWKGKPVVGGNVGGIPLQILDGETGYLVGDVKDCADRLLYLLRHPDEARRMGERGREHVREHFLMTRNLRDYLRLFGLLGGTLEEKGV